MRDKQKGQIQSFPRMSIWLIHRHVSGNKLAVTIACTHQYGFKIARQGGLQATGSYSTGGRSSLTFKGVYKAEIGTTVLVASIRDDGQTFHDNLTPIDAVLAVISSKPRAVCVPSRSSTSSKFSIVDMQPE